MLRPPRGALIDLWESVSFSKKKKKKKLKSFVCLLFYLFAHFFLTDVLSAFVQSLLAPPSTGRARRQCNSHLLLAQSLHLTLWKKFKKITQIQFNFFKNIKQTNSNSIFCALCAATDFARACPRRGTLQKKKNSNFRTCLPKFVLQFSL